MTKFRAVFHALATLYYRRSLASALTSFFPRNGNGILHSLLGGPPPSFCPIMAQMTRNCTALAAPAPLLARSLPLRFSLVSVGSGRGRFLWYLVTFMQPGPSGGGQWRGGTSGRGQTDMRACTLPKMHPPFRRGGGTASRPMFKENSLALWLPFLL